MCKGENKWRGGGDDLATTHFPPSFESHHHLGLFGSTHTHTRTLTHTHTLARTEIRSNEIFRLISTGDKRNCCWWQCGNVQLFSVSQKQTVVRGGFTRPKCTKQAASVTNLKQPKKNKLMVGRDFVDDRFATRHALY